MAEQNPNARPDEQTPEQDALEKSLEELSLDELLASVKDDLARVDAMMDGPGDAAQPEQPDAPAPDTPDAAEEAPKPGMQPLFEPKIPEEYADLTVDQQPQEPEPAEEKKHGRLPSGIRVLLYVCCVLAASVLLAVFAWRCADDVLSLILRIYRRDSELDKMLFDRAVPLLNVGGVSQEHWDTFVVASSNALMSTEPGGITAQYVEPSGTAFQAQAEALARDEASVREIALRMVRPQSAVGESAESKAIDKTQLDTQLASFARRSGSARKPSAGSSPPGGLERKRTGARRNTTSRMMWARRR